MAGRQQFSTFVAVYIAYIIFIDIRDVAAPLLAWRRYVIYWLLLLMCCCQQRPEVDKSAYAHNKITTHQYSNCEPQEKRHNSCSWKCFLSKYQATLSPELTSRSFRQLLANVSVSFIFIPIHRLHLWRNRLLSHSHYINVHQCYSLPHLLQAKTCLFHKLFPT